LFLGIFTPLFVLVFKRAVSTYNAMYIAGYDLETKKTRYKRLTLNKSDILIAIAVIGMIVVTTLVLTNVIPPVLDYS
jgi:energy-coupling factor transporter transmembrane protein EcfT